MPRILKHFLLFIIILISDYTYCQFYNSGSAPFKVKWRSIQTEHFKLIFPIEADSLAQKFASSLTQLYPYTTQSLNHEPESVDIIMYNQSVLSNAYVVWAPKRMELVTTPPQRQYAHDWLEQLALHEYRHVVQVDKLNQGFTRGLSYLTGEMGVGAMMAFIPLWFLEGDAVVNETALTKTGRGRDPGFIQEVMAAEMQEEKRFTYDEFYLGSYKNYIPDHYHYGYHMVAWMRMQYGEEAWGKVIDNVARRPFSFAPFYFKLKKETGLSKVELYEKTSDYLHQNWVLEDSVRSLAFTNSKSIKTGYKSNFVSYRFLHENADGSVLALRTSIDDIAKLVEIRTGREKVFYSLGSFQGSKIAYSEKYIAWEEIRYDLRWERKNYSVIRLYNRETEESTVFKQKERHFAPDISPNSTKLCLINTDIENNSKLEVYDILTKELLYKYSAGLNSNLSFPTWLDEERIAMVVLSKKGKAIKLLNTNSGEWSTLLEPGYENISYLSGSGNDLYFSYALNGRVNIYHIDIQSKNIQQVTNVPVGANYASTDYSGDSLLFSEYTSQGYKPRKALQIPKARNKYSNQAEYKYQLADEIAKQEHINIQDSLLPDMNFESKSYSKFGHMFNVHSWLVPFYINLDALPDESIKLIPGLTLLSQNSLSTVTSSLSYYYSNGHHHVRPSISFRMLYPVITIDYLYGGAPRLDVSLAKPTIIPEELKTYQEVNTEISLPLKFSTSRYTLTATPSVKHRYNNSYIADSSVYDNIVFNKDLINYYQGNSKLDFRFSFYWASKLAYKDLYPRWGLNYFTSHQKPIQNTQYWEENTVHILLGYLPGIFRHHSIKLLASGENGFGKRVAVPRGYSTNDFISYNYARKYSAEYSLPLLYPNLSVGPLAYFKRIQASLYFDYMAYKLDYRLGGTKYYYESENSSTGVELGIETNLFRFFWTFVPTIRYSYLIESGDYKLGFYFTTKYGFSLGNRLSSDI